VGGRWGISVDVSFKEISIRFAVVAACCIAVSCNCTTVLACLVDVALRNSLAWENSSGILPKCARSLLATAVEISEESESLMSSSINNAMEQIAAAVSTGSLGRRDTVIRMLTIFNLLYCSPASTQPFLLSQERASSRDWTGLLLPKISAEIPEQKGRLRDGVGVPDKLVLRGTLLGRERLPLSLSSIEGRAWVVGGGDVEFWIAEEVEKSYENN
jgi:hypothetical protein